MLTLPDPATGLPTGVGATAITIAPLGWVFPAPGVTCGSLGATFGSNRGNLLSQTRTITVPVGATYTSATALAKLDGTLHDGAADPTFSILIPISSTTGCVLIGDCPDTRTPIPPGVTLSTPTRGTVTSGVPTVYWHDPMTITVPGCPGGTGTADARLQRRHVPDGRAHGDPSGRDIRGDLRCCVPGARNGFDLLDDHVPGQQRHHESLQRVHRPERGRA